VIDHAENSRLTIGSARKDSHNPLFREDKPWEVRYDNLYANVTYDTREKLYKCWYSPFIVDSATSSVPREERSTVPYRAGEREMGVCYAVSKDGIRWAKPSLGIVDFAGSRNNNLVLRGPHGSGILLDSHDPYSSRRYKMLFADVRFGGKANNNSDPHMYEAYSADGLHWSEPAELVGVNAVGDTHNNALWVPERNAYVGITRLWRNHSRLVARMESSDFIHWSPAVEVLSATDDQPERQPYAMPVFQHAGMYLGLLMVFNTKTGTVDCELTRSVDTVSWERVCDGTPLLPLGPAGAYDSGCIYAAAAPVFTKDGVRIYYGGSNGLHSSWRDGFFCLAHLRPDGFAAVEPAADGQTATMITTAVDCGTNLRISADAPSGTVRVGVVGTSDLTLESCKPTSGAVSDHIVKWRGKDLRALHGKKVQLLFELKAAKLYSFSFDEARS
jgi:hypothetical protein